MRINIPDEIDDDRELVLDFSEVDEAFFRVTDAVGLGLTTVFFGGDGFMGVSFGGGGVSGRSGLNMLLRFFSRSRSTDCTNSLAGVLDLEWRLPASTFFGGDLPTLGCVDGLGTGVTVADDFGLNNLRTELDFWGLELPSDSESEYTFGLLSIGIFRAFAATLSLTFASTTTLLLTTRGSGFLTGSGLRTSGFFFWSESLESELEESESEDELLLLEPDEEDEVVEELEEEPLSELEASVCNVRINY